MPRRSAGILLYRITGVWGNHEGSMLLWVLILALFGAMVAQFGNNLPASLKALVLAVQSWVACAFYLFILLTSNPFLRLAQAPLSALAGGDAGENAELIVRILEGEPGPPRNVVLLNAAAALMIAGRAEDLSGGVRCAADAIDSGAGLHLLARLRKFDRP